MPNIRDDLRPEEVMYINAFKYTPKMRLNAAELEQAVFLTLKKQMEAAAPLAPDGTLRVDASVPNTPSMSSGLRRCKTASEPCTNAISWARST